MQRFLATLFLLLILVGALGFYLGWFTVRARDGNGDADVTLSVDKEKMVEDKDTVVGDMQDLGNKLRD
jgi:hypothetical protein